MVKQSNIWMHSLMDKLWWKDCFLNDINSIWHFFATLFLWSTCTHWSLYWVLPFNCLIAQAVEVSDQSHDTNSARLGQDDLLKFTPSITTGMKMCFKWLWTWHQYSVFVCSYSCFSCKTFEALNVLMCLHSENLVSFSISQVNPTSYEGYSVPFFVLLLQLVYQTQPLTTLCCKMI